MTIDTENLKAVAEQAIAGGWKTIHLEPGTLLELLNEIESLKKDLKSYMDACNYEVNRATKYEDIVTLAKVWLDCGGDWNSKNHLADAIEKLGESEVMVERGTKAWADVENPTEWVEDLRGE